MKLYIVMSLYTAALLLTWPLMESWVKVLDILFLAVGWVWVLKTWALQDLEERGVIP